MMRRTPHLLLVAALAVLAVAGAAFPVVPAGADPLTDLRAERDRTQAEAVGAAQSYSDALGEHAAQETEIARLEAEIPKLRARSDELKIQVRDRAVEMYQQGSSMPLSRMIDAGSVVEAARAIQLSSSAANHDRDLAAELARTAAQLTRDEADLRVRKAAQDAIVGQLADQKIGLDIALAAADIAVKNLEAVGASQAEFSTVDGAAAGQVRTGAAICPVAGTTVFVNDWGAPRSGGRTHQGTDLLAAMSTPLVAVVAGTIDWDLDDLGGTGVWLHGDDGVGYYYAHLSKWEGTAPRRVTRGEIIGYVGDTGNARGGPPHLHFGVRAPTGEMVNPFPTVRVLCQG
ncbi:MAG: peptidoglycan DD-metalloendopeptidase family protein [Acidimicrobiia bacterium]|nr:peptidoglycan DD-metalloendopeptidase family protein [Acidimicrobiia bacterium]